MSTIPSKPTTSKPTTSSPRAGDSARPEITVQTPKPKASFLESARHASKYVSTGVGAGAAGGAVVAGLFTPLDRVLNVAQENGMPVRQALRQVWREGPYRGLSQTVVQRCGQGVSSMPMYDFGKYGLDLLTGGQEGELSSFISGVLIGGAMGTVYGVVSTPKYQTWRTGEGWVQTVQRMAREGGYKAFFKGCKSTAYRDMVFGGVFYPIKTKGSKWAKEPGPDGERSTEELRQRQMAVALAAAGAGVVASSPFNYTRTRAFNTQPRENEPGPLARFRELYKEVVNSPQASRALRRRLIFGLGVTRATSGMALQSLVYDALMRYAEGEK